MVYTHRAKINGHVFSITVEFDGEVYPNSYRWPTPKREIRGRVRYGRKVVSKVSRTIECPKRSHGRGDISETLYGVLWGSVGERLARAVRRGMKSLPEIEREFLDSLSEEMRHDTHQRKCVEQACDGCDGFQEGSYNCAYLGEYTPEWAACCR